MDKNRIAVLDADEKQSKNLCTFLADHNYETTQIKSMTDMAGHLGVSEYRVIILNLDNMAVNNKTFKELKRKKPSLKIIAYSQRRFHPELEEALREYISVCLAKPVDLDELIYWLKSVFENNEETC